MCAFCSCAAFDGTSWSSCRAPSVNTVDNTTTLTCNCDITATIAAFAAAEAVVDCSGATLGTQVFDSCGKCGGTVTDAARCSAVAAANRTADPSNRNDDAAIIGGVIGGMLFIGLMVAAYLRYKQQNVLLTTIQESQAKYVAAAAANPADAGISPVYEQPLPPSDAAARAQWDNQLRLLQQLQILTATHVATYALPVQQALMPAPAPASATLSHAPRHAVHGDFVLDDNGTIIFITSVIGATSIAPSAGSWQLEAAPQVRATTMPIATAAMGQGCGHAQAQDQAGMQQLLQLENLQQQFRAQRHQPSPPPVAAVAQGYGNDQAQDQARMQHLLQLESLQQQFRAQRQQPPAPSTPPPAYQRTTR